MIHRLRKLFGNLIGGSEKARKVKRSKRTFRRIAFEPLETRRLLSATGSISGFAYVDPANTGQMAGASAGLGGITMQLWSVDGQGNTSAVAGIGPTQTLADGSYKFNGLAAGNYEVQIEPSAKLAIGKLTPGTAGGTAGTNDIQLSLTDGQAASGNDFAISGPQSSLLSLRMYLASTGTPNQYLKSMHAAPTVATGDPGAPGHYTATFTTGGAAVAIAAADAVITASDSPTLASMTVSIANLLDGSNEVLAATTSGTPLTANYSGGSLSISGVADVATYQTVLRSVTYNDSLFFAHTGSRTISVVVNDGTRTSLAATSTISVVLGTPSQPVITTSPAAATINAGGTTSFTAAASGTPAPTVQWQVNTGSGFANISDGGVYSGSATGTLTITGATAAMNGYQYQAVIANIAGSATSNAATLTVDFAPTVTTSPTAQTVNAGSSVTFTAAASGNPAATVQWEVSTDGGSTFTDIAGAMSASYSFTAAAADNGDQYEAVFTNSTGSATSNAATLTVDFAPTVTTSPTAQTVNAGSSVTFTAAAGGNPAATVQWKVSTDGGSTFTDIAGATSASYSFTAAAADNGDQYEAVFTNSTGSATSNAATLTVDFAPTVTTSPTAQTVNAGSSVTFTAAASGNPAATVQWKVSTDGGSTFTDIAGATSAGYSFTAAAADNGDQYEAVFTNSTGSATSNAATLTVDFAPTVTTSPTAQTVNAGSSVTFTAAAGGNPAATVQWEVSIDGGVTFTDIAGATSAGYSFTAAAADNGDQYEAVFTNSAGSATSNAATLTVDFAPTVTTSPTAQTVNAGSSVTFTAAAGGNPAATVQWKVSTDGGSTFTDIAGATSAGYSFAAAAADNGDQYEAVFTNSAGSATSDAATLTVDFAPTVTTSPAAQTVNAGSSVTFTAAASGNPPPTVQWEVSSDGGLTFTDIAGATSASYSFTAAAADNGNQYEAVFTNSAGTATTNPATLTVDFAPTVTTNPTSQVVTAGGTVTLTAAAGANPAATVQWTVSSDGGLTFTDIAGATSATYSFTAMAADNGNQYEAVFTNSFGSATTTAATLNIAGYLVTADQSLLGPDNDTAASFTIGGVSQGDAYTYSVASDGGPGTVTGSGTVTSSSPSQDVTVDVSSLPGGNLTYSVQVTHGSSTGNTVTAATVLDKTPPTGYTITGLPATIDNASAASVSFIVNSPAAETGDTFAYTISNPSDTSGKSVTGSGAISATAQSVTGVDVSSLANGTLSFSITLTDTVGNVGLPVSATATLSQLAVTSAPAATATVGQAYTYTIQTNAALGDTVTVTPGATLPAGMNFDAASNTFTWTPAADQEGTTQSYTATVMDTTTGNTVTLGPVFVAVAAANGLTVVAPASTIATGSPVLVGFQDTNTGTPTYTITTSSSIDPTGADLTGTILPRTNQVLRIVTDQGEMDLELFNNFTPNTVTHFVDLVNSGTFDPSTYANFTGTFQLDVGAVTTSAITFDASNLTATAANIQSALVAAGFTGATATVASGAAAPTFSFNVTFSASESPITSTAAAKALPVAFSNSASDLATAQTLTFTAPVPDFYRIISTFVNQGGVGGLDGATTIPVELNSNLRFTSSGLLAMANNGVDGNSSEFFITNPDDMSNGFLDFRYTIFGKLISGDNVRAAIAATPVESNGGSPPEISQPLTAPKILSMSVVNQTSGGVLELQAAPGATVGDTYTVTINNGLGQLQSFQVHVGFTGPFTLSVGSGSSATVPPPIDFDSGNLTTTAANIQSALVAEGFAETTVSVDSGSTAASLKFDVTFPAPEQAITATTSGLPVTFYNSVTASQNLQAFQVLTFDITGTGAYDPPNPWVDPINGNDEITTAAGTPATFTPQGESADGSTVQVGVQTMLAVPTVPGAFVDNSFLNTSTAQNFPAQNPNPNITVTQNGSSYTVTPAAGFYGVQVLEVTGLDAVSGTFQLQVGSTTTAAIDFDSANLTATAANIQSALVTAGLTGATVTVDQASGAENFSFDVTFAASQADITYTAATANPLPITFANSATAAAASQTLTFTATGPTWDAGSGISPAINPAYRAFVPVFVDPPAPAIGDITANGQTVNGSTSNNNSSLATALSFDVTGAVAGAIVSVYMDGGTTPIVTGTVATGATTITLTTDGATTIGDGSHTFTVKQSLATSALFLYADWSDASGPATQFNIPASSVVSGPSSGVGVTINAGT